MGISKQRWSSEEEETLRAGVAKHGEGKWSIIIKDPEFRTILHLRTNVDLKDKWRNMKVMASGCGSRTRARPLTKNTQQVPKHGSNIVAPAATIKPLAISREPLDNVMSKNPIFRIEDLILEAVESLKEPRGSNKTAIAKYIQEHYSTPTKFDRLLGESLKLLAENGQLTKVRYLYRIAPSLPSGNVGTAPSLPSVVDEKLEDTPIPPRVDPIEPRVITMAQIEAELETMKSMSPEQAVNFAAQAVREAEAAIAAAEAAAKEAEDAELDAEVAEAFYQVSMKELESKRNKYLCKGNLHQCPLSTPWR